MRAAGVSLPCAPLRSLCCEALNKSQAPPQRALRQELGLHGSHHGAQQRVGTPGICSLAGLQTKSCCGAPQLRGAGAKSSSASDFLHLVAGKVSGELGGFLLLRDSILCLLLLPLVPFWGRKCKNPSYSPGWGMCSGRLACPASSPGGEKEPCATEGTVTRLWVHTHPLALHPAGCRSCGDGPEAPTEVSRPLQTSPQHLRRRLPLQTKHRLVNGQHTWDARRVTA